MADFAAARDGVFNLKSEAALASVSSSASWLSTAPDGTKRVVLTLRTAGVTLRWDATAATAGANGIDYPIGTYEFDVNSKLISGARMIQNGGTTTGWVQFFG